jgi:hypothetical protein
MLLLPVSVCCCQRNSEAVESKEYVTGLLFSTGKITHKNNNQFFNVRTIDFGLGGGGEAVALAVTSTSSSSCSILASCSSDICC